MLLLSFSSYDIYVIRVYVKVPRPGLGHIGVESVLVAAASDLQNMYLITLYLIGHGRKSGAVVLVATP